MPPAEHVVLLDSTGRAAGTMPKTSVHGPSTPLHLAFSCYVVHPGGGGVLLAQRAHSKATWPGVWSNACCGHPAADESLEAAVARRLEQELGLRPRRVALLLPDFTYRAAMPDGTIEHEVCPVFVAEVLGAPCPDPREVADLAWISWPALVARAECEPASLSPWSVEQIRLLHASGWAPGSWPDAGSTPRRRTPRASEDVDPFAPVLGPLDDVLGDLLDQKAAELLDIDGGLAPVVDEVRALVEAGGKRLRPAFVHWGHAAGGGGAADAVAHVGAAVELLHTFALLHDDVMDRSTRRRGRDAAHVSFAKQHADGGFEGDSGWFGSSAAVLAGDLAFVWADEALERAALDAATHAEVRARFAVLRNEVMAGQYLDLVLAGDPRADEVGARRVAVLKSARYTVTRPLELGAAAAGADAAIERALRVYGDAVGLAFQLRDDVLGLFGSERVTGKGTLDDLREGKRTVLVLRARRLADDRQAATIDAALGDPTVDDERAEQVRDVVRATGALASVERLIEHELERAEGALGCLPSDARAGLRALAMAAARRTS